MKHVLVTGGTDGLGKVTAQKLKTAGFDVTILGHDADKTKKVAQEIDSNYVVADVSDASAVQEAVAQAVNTALIDILINNAGIWIQGPLENNEPAQIQEVMNVNALGTIYCTQAVIVAMKQRKAGKIINVISQGGLYAKAERGVYNASKWALTGFTKAMQAELKPYNVSVVGLYPGALKNTGIFAKAGNDRDMSKALDPAVVADAIVYLCRLHDGINVSEFGIENLAY